MHEGKIYQTGDINLAAALMACGVPLSPTDPAVMVQPEDGPRYASFRLLDRTIDGKDETDSMMARWKHGGALPPDHGFSIIADFLIERRERAPEAKSTDEMIAFAVDYMTAQGRAAGMNGVRNVNDIPDRLRRAPHTPETFILAFVHCRDLLFGIINKMKRTDYHFQRDEVRHAIISNTLPAWQRKELTARING